jgi:hypothetical protein
MIYTENNCLVYIFFEHVQTAMKPRACKRRYPEGFRYSGKLRRCKFRCFELVLSLAGKLVVEIGEMGMRGNTPTTSRP